MRVGAVILSYRGWPEVVDTASAVSTGTLPAHPVIIVDNDSPDGTAERVRTAHPDLRVLALPTNEGYGHGMNAGAVELAHSDLDALLFLTQECRLDRTALQLLVDALNADGRLGAVGPLLLRRSDPDTIWSAGGTLSRGWRRPAHLRCGDALATLTEREVTDVTWLDGAALLVRSAAFQDIGGFRSDLFLYWEDVDLALRLRDHGWRVACVPAARAWQEPSMTPPYLMARNKMRVLWSRRDWSGALLSAVESVMAVANDLVRRRSLARARARLIGIVHAISGRLDRSAASVR